MRNTNPTCSSFVTSHKSLLINNFVSTHSAGSNCESDESVGVLDTLKMFIEKQVITDVSDVAVPPPIYPFKIVFGKTSDLQSYTSAYVAGFVSRKILQKIVCKTCKTYMCASENLPEKCIN